MFQQQYEESVEETKRNDCLNQVVTGDLKADLEWNFTREARVGE